MTAPDSAKKLATAAARHETDLYKALGISYARSTHSRPIIRPILGRASAEDISLVSDVKTATVIFPVPELGLTSLRVLLWQYLEDASPYKTASDLAGTVRTNLHMTETDS